MPRYSERVAAARADATGQLTQARSVNGHLIYHKAGLSAEQVTAVLRRAVEAARARAASSAPGREKDAPVTGEGRAAQASF